MRGRSAAMVLAGAGLLVLLVVLKQSIGSAADSRPRPARPASEESAPHEGSPAATPATGNREAKLPPRDPGNRVAPDSGSADGGGAPSLSSDGTAAAPPEVFKKRPPVANKTLLRAQVEAVAPLVDACVARATGKKDGTAAMHFIVAPKGDEAVIELTAVDEDGTTIQNAAMLECMHQTALQMKFTPAPDSDAVVAKREVVVENGKVTVNRLVDFSYLRK